MDGLLVCESDGWHIWASFGMRKLCEWYAKTNQNSSETEAHPVITKPLSTISSFCLCGFDTRFALAMDGPLVGESDGCHTWASVGVRKLCEWYANGMRKQIKTQVKPKHIR